MMQWTALLMVVILGRNGNMALERRRFFCVEEVTSVLKIGNGTL